MNETKVKKSTTPLEMTAAHLSKQTSGGDEDDKEMEDDHMQAQVDVEAADAAKKVLRKKAEVPLDDNKIGSSEETALDEAVDNEDSKDPEDDESQK